MKKVLILLVLMIYVAGLAGCSNSSEKISLMNGSIMSGSKVLGVTEYKGYEAKTVIDNVGTIKYYRCNSIEDCPHNIGNILEEDMTGYEKKSKYYTMYHGTQICLYVPDGDGYIESFMLLNDVGLMSENQAIDTMYKESVNLYLSDDIASVNYNDILSLNVNNWEFSVRNNEVMIPGLIRIKEDDGSVVATEHITMEGRSLAKASSAKYDYYQYNGTIIQAAIGTDITSLISFQ